MKASKYRKITKEDAENLKVGDTVLIYTPESGITDKFDENDTKNISSTIVDSIAWGNINLSFGFPENGFQFDNFQLKIGTLHKTLNELYEEGRYWILANE